jgi:hypothetical protein
MNVRFDGRCSLGGRVLLLESTRNATEVPNLVKYAY